MSPAPLATEPRRLYISHLAEYDWLTALEFGRVDDGQPSENWEGVGPHFGYLHTGPDHDGDPTVGFKVVGFSELDPEDPSYARIWEPPLFEAPQLGLPAASAGEILLAAASLYGDGQSLNRTLFESATQCEGGRALKAWTACLHAGDSMAHFALGYTLYELGRFRDAYRHLRYYAGIAPAQPWTHCWLGKAAEAIGEDGEALSAYVQAIELTEAGGEETDAPELLAVLERRLGGSH
jgi:tetratricopeptide (TPR) repeat protein